MNRKYHNQRGDASMLVISILALLAIGAAVYFAYQAHTKTTATTPAPSASTSPSSTPVISQSEGEDMALYRVSAFFNGYAAGFPQTGNATATASFLSSNLSQSLINAGANTYWCGQQNVPLAWHFNNIRNSTNTIQIDTVSVGYSPEITIEATYDKSSHLISAITCPHN